MECHLMHFWCFSFSITLIHTLFSLSVCAAVTWEYCLSSCIWKEPGSTGLHLCRTMRQAEGAVEEPKLSTSHSLVPPGFCSWVSHWRVRQGQWGGEPTCVLLHLRIWDQSGPLFCRYRHLIWWRDQTLLNFLLLSEQVGLLSSASLY